MAGSKARYKIVDEPTPGPLEAWAMNPFVPFLLFMIFPYVGAPLFVFNTLALKGRSWLWELALLAVASLLRFGIPLSVAMWMAGQGVPISWFKYLAILPLAAALWLGYRVFASQTATDQIKTYFHPVEGR